MDVEAVECGSPVPPEETPPDPRHRHCSRSADRLPLILHLHLKVCCVGARADRLPTAGHAPSSPIGCAYLSAARRPHLPRATSKALPPCDVIAAIPPVSVCHHRERSALLKDITEEWLLPSLPADPDAEETEVRQQKRTAFVSFFL